MGNQTWDFPIRGPVPYHCITAAPTSKKQGVQAGFRAKPVQQSITAPKPRRTQPETCFYFSLNVIKCEAKSAGFENESDIQPCDETKALTGSHHFLLYPVSLVLVYPRFGGTPDLLLSLQRDLFHQPNFSY